MGEEVVRCFADGGGANAVRGADFRMQDSATRVLVNGAPASYAAAEGQELVVSPASGLVQGKTFTVTVDYAGVPNVVTDPDTSIEGWVLTDDGAVVVNEPRDADWFEQPYNAPAKEAAFWGPAVADFSDPALLFNRTVYYRGGMTLQALREKIGDFGFFSLLRT